MLKQYSIIDLIKQVKALIHKNTDIKAFDSFAEKESKFVLVEFVESQPNNSKTSYRTKYVVYLHLFDNQNNSINKKSNVEMYKMINKIESAFTEDLEIEEPYQLAFQEYKGVRDIFKEENGSIHAVLEFEFNVTYGFICK